MVATSGAKLLRDDAVAALCAKLLPLAEVLTPNIPEAEILSGMTITKRRRYGGGPHRAISEKYGCAVLCKGGHQINDADDLLWQRRRGQVVPGHAASTTPTPTAPAARCPAPLPPTWPRAMTWTPRWSAPKAYISGALAAMLDLGHGSGPMDHMFAAERGVRANEKDFYLSERPDLVRRGRVPGRDPDRHLVCAAGHGEGLCGHSASATSSAAP